MPRKYTDEQMLKVKQLLAKGWTHDTIREKMGEHVMRAYSQYKRRQEKPKASTVDTLYPASYYKDNNLPSPYDN